MSLIKLTDVSYSYKVPADDDSYTWQVGVKDVNLEIEKGSFVALVGHNGCGKSTLAKLLNGLFIPHKGTVEVDGMTTDDPKNIFKIRSTVGMVFQNPDNQMVTSIVEEDIAFGPENLGVPQKEIVERVKWALDKVGMSKFAKNTTTKLSGGQKQRIAIAGALAMHPQVLVLDESTAMLDPQGRKEVLEVVHSLNKEENMTVVLITHFMEEVLGADKVVVMNHGQKVTEGTPMEVFSRSQLLDEVGLKIPRTIELARKLNSAGWDVDVNCTDATELGDRVCQLLQNN